MSEHRIYLSGKQKSNIDVDLLARAIVAIAQQLPSQTPSDDNEEQS